MSVQLGQCEDGKRLLYDRATYQFFVGARPLEYEDVARLDAQGRVNWFALEQRDWFYRIDRDALRDRAEAARADAQEGDAGDPFEQVRRDARRNDSILEGRLAEANDALVRAVADKLEAQGLTLPATERVASENPLAIQELPDGMEPLKQVVKQEGRSMTFLERVLMRRIIKNDDKAKVRRERRGQRQAERGGAEVEEAMAEVERG